TSAKMARSVARTVFGAVGMPAEVTYDVAMAMSELATNVYVHAFGGAAPKAPPVAGLPEIWAYLRWGSHPEVVLKVFDSAPWHGSMPEGPLRPPPAAESGRGLAVVNALAAEYGGRWGIHRTRSRLGGFPVPGKAVFLAVPIPPDCPARSLRPVTKP